MPLRIDIEAGVAQYLPFAKKKLAELYELPIDRKLIYVSSGESIYVQRGEVDLIRIRGAVDEMGMTVTSPFAPTWSNVVLTQADLTAAGVDPSRPVPAPFSVAASGTRLKTSPIVDSSTLRIAMIQRNLKATGFEFAERITRFLTGSEVDAALYCDQGFFVDLSLYVGQPFYDALSKVVGSYQYPINHASAPSLNFFPEVDFSTYRGPLPLDNETKHRISYGDPAAPTVLMNTNYRPNGASQFPQELTSIVDTVPDGTVLSLRKAEVLLETQTVYLSNHKYSDSLDVQVYRYADSYYQTVAPSSFGFSLYGIFLTGDGTLVPYPGAGGPFADGPLNGSRQYRAKHVQRRRGPDGWTDTLTDVLPSQEIMQFSRDGNAAVVTAPPAQEFSFTTHQDGASQTQYAQTPYLASGISYAKGASTGPDLYWVLDREARGATSPFNIYSTAVTSVVTQTGDFVTTRFISPADGKQFCTTLFNKLLVNKSDGTQTGPGTGTFQSAASVINTTYRALSAEHKTYDYPLAATFPAFYAAARNTIGLQIFNPKQLAMLDYAPPSFAFDFVYCLYQPRTGKFLYFKVALTTIFDLFTIYLPAANALIAALGAGDAVAFKAKQTAFNALHTVLIDGGLSMDFLVLAANSIGSGKTTVLL
jgi:hypothetical protein